MAKRIAVIVFLGALGIGAAVYLGQPKEDRQLEQLKASNIVLAESAERVKQLDQETIELQLGSTDYKIYKLCHQAAPTTKEHQRLCERVEKKLAAKQAEAKAHPW
jgi:hypothetical protein